MYLKELRPNCTVPGQYTDYRSKEVSFNPTLMPLLAHPPGECHDFGNKYMAPSQKPNNRPWLPFPILMVPNSQTVQGSSLNNMVALHTQRRLEVPGDKKSPSLSPWMPEAMNVNKG
jgi:hypothetical protein